ncbi:unannotated protein [freshwater metagenome]|uniref:Unannotated protein n=1 Tax=freshwater metagenome TaxID=449393 RepID=A0A6J6NMT9_9ZZZZ
MLVITGKPSNQLPTQSFAPRCLKRRRCAASCMRDANCACMRPINRYAMTQTGSELSLTAMASIKMFCPNIQTTDHALRNEGMVRSSVRTCGYARPSVAIDALSMTCGKTDASSAIPPRCGLLLPTTCNPLSQVWTFHRDSGVDSVTRQHNGVSGERE